MAWICIYSAVYHTMLGVKHIQWVGTYEDDIYVCFYKHIKIRGLGSDTLKVTQNIGRKYAYDMLILCVNIFKMGAKSVGLSHIAYTVIHKL